MPDTTEGPKKFTLGWAGWLLLAAVVFVVVTLILRIITPPVTPIAISQTADGRQNMDGSASIFNNVIYKGPEPTFPQKLPILTADVSEAAAQKVVDYLVGYYQLSPHPELPNTWSNKDFMLYKNSNNHEYLFTVKNGELQNPRLSLADAKQAAEKLIQGYPGLAGLSLIEDRTKYLRLGGKGGADGDVTVAADADTISLEYSWKIQDVPIFLPKRYDGSFVAIIGSDLKPVRLSFPLSIPTIGEQVSMNPLLTVKEAIGQINRSIGSIIYAEQTDFVPFDVSKIAAGQLDSVSLEYRIDPELKLAIPYYRFSGSIRNTSGSIYTAQLLTPAVATAPAK